MEEKKLNSITGDKKSKDWSYEMEAEMESRLQQAEEQGGSFKHLHQKELLKVKVRTCDWDKEEIGFLSNKKDRKK